MIIKTSYVANDGTVFDNEKSCVDYEARQHAKAQDELRVLNRLCVFYNSEGEVIKMTERFDESDVYGVHIKCSADEVDLVEQVFGAHFDTLYYTLMDSDFRMNHEVILAYDWVGSGNGWKEIDYEQQEWISMVSKILKWA